MADDGGGRFGSYDEKLARHQPDSALCGRLVLIKLRQKDWARGTRPQMANTSRALRHDMQVSGAASDHGRFLSYSVIPFVRSER